MAFEKFQKQLEIEYISSILETLNDSALLDEAFLSRAIVKNEDTALNFTQAREHLRSSKVRNQPGLKIDPRNREGNRHGFFKAPIWFRNTTETKLDNMALDAAAFHAQGKLTSKYNLTISGVVPEVLADFQQIPVKAEENVKKRFAKIVSKKGTPKNLDTTKKYLQECLAECEKNKEEENKIPKLTRQIEYISSIRKTLSDRELLDEAFEARGLVTLKRDNDTKALDFTKTSNLLRVSPPLNLPILDDHGFFKEAGSSKENLEAKIKNMALETAATAAQGILSKDESNLLKERFSEIVSKEGVPNNLNAINAYFKILLVENQKLIDKEENKNSNLNSLLSHVKAAKESDSLREKVQKEITTTFEKMDTNSSNPKLNPNNIKREISSKLNQHEQKIKDGFSDFLQNLKQNPNENPVENSQTNNSSEKLTKAIQDKNEYLQNIIPNIKEEIEKSAIIFPPTFTLESYIGKEFINSVLEILKDEKLLDNATRIRQGIERKIDGYSFSIPLSEAEQLGISFEKDTQKKDVYFSDPQRIQQPDFFDPSANIDLKTNYLIDSAIMGAALKTQNKYGPYIYTEEFINLFNHDNLTKNLNEKIKETCKQNKKPLPNDLSSTISCLEDCQKSINEEKNNENTERKLNIISNHLEFSSNLFILDEKIKFVNNLAKVNGVTLPKLNDKKLIVEIGDLATAFLEDLQNKFEPSNVNDQGIPKSVVNLTNTLEKANGILYQHLQTAVNTLKNSDVFKQIHAEKRKLEKRIENLTTVNKHSSLINEYKELHKELQKLEEELDPLHYLNSDDPLPNSYEITKKTDVCKSTLKDIKSKTDDLIYKESRERAQNSFSPAFSLGHAYGCTFFSNRNNGNQKREEAAPIQENTHSDQASPQK